MLARQYVVVVVELCACICIGPFQPMFHMILFFVLFCFSCNTLLGHIVSTLIFAQMIFWLLMMVICDPLASTHVTIIFEPMRWPRHIQYEISNSSYYISISTTIIYDNARPCGCVCVSLFFRCFCCCWHDSTHILFSFDVFFPLSIWFVRVCKYCDCVEWMYIQNIEKKIFLWNIHNHLRNVWKCHAAHAGPT